MNPPPAIDPELLRILMFCMKQICIGLDQPETTKGIQFALAFWKGEPGSDSANIVYGGSTSPGDTAAALKQVLARLECQVKSGMDEKFEKAKAMMEAKDEPRH